MSRTAHLDDLTNALRARVAAGYRHTTWRGTPVRIVAVARSAVRVRFPDGRIERVHPEDVTA